MSRLSLLFLGCMGLVFIAVPVQPGQGRAATATPTLARSQPTSAPERPAATPGPAALLAPTTAPVLPFLTPVVRESSDQLDPPELRAVWVDAFHDGFKTPEQVDALVAWARDANLNALFVQVRRRGDAYYVKSFEPRSEDPDLVPGFDALQ